MEIEIGRRIRDLRLKKGTTQEDIANFLHITPQAISKWENGNSAPDINLLPQISVYFGVKIDELFQMTKEEQYERIHNSIWNDLAMTQEVFCDKVNILMKALEENSEDIRAYQLLAELYHFAAECADKKAVEYAKIGLQKKPEERSLHVQLADALHGVTGDGYIDNHIELINYYKNFIKMHPNNKLAYKILLKQLIADGRLKEARETLEEAEKFGMEYYYLFYRGDILFKSGEREDAIKFYDQAVAQWPDIWQSWCTRADRMLMLDQVEEAIADYQKCFIMQKSGERMIDGLLSLAQIYRQQEKRKEELNVWKTYLQVMEEDYHLITGERIEQILNRISELENS